MRAFAALVTVLVVILAYFGFADAAPRAAASHILVKTEEEANKLKERIAAGEECKFRPLAGAAQSGYGIWREERWA